MQAVKEVSQPLGMEDAREVGRHEVLVRRQQRSDGAVDEHHVVPLRSANRVHERCLWPLLQQACVRAALVVTIRRPVSPSNEGQVASP